MSKRHSQYLLISLNSVATISQPKRNHKNKAWSEDNDGQRGNISVWVCECKIVCTWCPFQSLKMIDVWLCPLGFRHPSDPRAYGLPGLFRHRQCCLDVQAGTLGRMLGQESTLCLETWHILTWSTSKFSTLFLAAVFHICSSHPLWTSPIYPRSLLCMKSWRDMKSWNSERRFQCTPGTTESAGYLPLVCWWRHHSAPSRNLRTTYSKTLKGSKRQSKE